MITIFILERRNLWYFHNKMPSLIALIWVWCWVSSFPIDHVTKVHEKWKLLICGDRLRIVSGSKEHIKHAPSYVKKKWLVFKRKPFHTPWKCPTFVFFFIDCTTIEFGFLFIYTGYIKIFNNTAKIVFCYGKKKMCFWK